MAGHSRYSVTDKGAGLDASILANKQGIRNCVDLEDAETLSIAAASAHFYGLLHEGGIKFDLQLLFSIHKYCFEPLYSWAGKVRTVNISKDGMLFAPVQYIDQALYEFGILLKKKSTKRIADKEELALALAEIHNEFNAIHPFREGNGRTIRLFLDLLAVKYGYNPIDWYAKSKKDYFFACKEGVIGNHEMMAAIIKTGLKKIDK